MTKKIKLYTEYGGWPLWGVGEIDNIDPATLPITQSLINRLNQWQSTYNATLADYPPESGFPSKEAEEEWYREGIRLWLQLQQELGADYEVYYHFLYKGEGHLFTLGQLPHELRTQWLNDDTTDLQS
ncbi:hypothetical protein HJG54_17870 [Leptolyngbya sp. NK1-12]|uniref:Uncharacterized protein n=1 Tax=Leptolyngbya sp. NK1-12 TaxID=2547451 RepID=A0AA96WG86_9CYAN|nr:hypothetical protein [Leptolyngbya sp. NK1-12]WNZ24535.1 hypothetical protein HJG54_17870 [Leptolyngbya sp. NK1-12]